MVPLERPDCPPAARTVIEPRESTTDALIRAAGEADVDLSGPGTWIQDVVDGGALDRLFLDRDREHDDKFAMLALELWGHLFLVTPAEIEVYETDEVELPKLGRT